MYCKVHRTLKKDGVILEVQGNRIGSMMQDGSPTPERFRVLIRRHKTELLDELKTHIVVRISGEDFFGPALMEDAAARSMAKEVQ